MPKPSDINQLMLEANMIAHEVADLLYIMEKHSRQVFDALRQQPPDAAQASRFNKDLYAALGKALECNKELRDHIFAAQLLSAARRKNGHTGTDGVDGADSGG